uniref:RPAP1_N domain-containing protein n=1 Tax=Steinernema glaseri TaxID=37863 RepID=A0A1I7Z3Y7_9BILA
MQDNGETTIRRPKPGEDDDDLLRMEEEFRRAGKPSAATVVRVGQKPAPPHAAPEPIVQAPKPKAKKIKVGAGKVNIQLEMIPEEASCVLREVKERYVGYFEIPDKCPPFVAEKAEPSKLSDDGFPDAVDLSDYITGPLKAAPGKSIFATAFLAENGELQTEVEEQYRPSEEESSEDPFKENDQKIASMDQSEVDDALKEVASSLSPEVIEMLRKRGQKKLAQGGNKVPQYIPARMSKFKQNKTGVAPPPPKAKETPKNPHVEEAIKNMEIMSTKDEEYARLAVDAVQLEFQAKCIRNLRPRQQENVVNLFDVLKRSNSKTSDELILLAREKIEDAQKLYLEEVRLSEDKTVLQFPAHINPLLDNAWTFVPIRKVLDAVQQRGEVTQDDIEIVQLALLWSLLLFTEKETLFYLTIQLNDVYVRLGEVFLMGPDVYEDSVIAECLDRFLRLYLLKQAEQGFKGEANNENRFNKGLRLSLVSPVSGLDNFVAFYEDLMQRFEEFSNGNVNFTLHLLIGAYLNSSLQDSLLTIRALWDPKRALLRLAIANSPAMESIVNTVGNARPLQLDTVQDHFYEAYSSIIIQYALALKMDTVTAERNPTMFALAVKELEAFLEHQKRKSGEASENCFETLVPAANSALEKSRDV